MKTGLRLFLSSAGFGIAIASVYWLSSGDPTGTLLLGLMAAALLFAAGYVIFAEREARLSGDRASASNKDVAGESVGVFTTASTWPIVCAAGLCLMLLGLVTWSGFAWAGGCMFLSSFWQMIRETR